MLCLLGQTAPTVSSAHAFLCQTRSWLCQSLWVFALSDYACDLRTPELTICLHGQTVLTFIHGGNDAPTTSLISSLLHWDQDDPSQTWRLGDLTASPWPFAALLDLCRGTQLVDVDGAEEAEAMGLTSRLLGMRGRWGVWLVEGGYDDIIEVTWRGGGGHMSRNKRQKRGR